MVCRAHRHADAGCIGVTLVGVPAAIIGHTRDVAWGLTNTQADVIDFFAEKINPDDANQYWHGGAWQDVETVDEVINVRGGRRSITRLASRRTGRSSLSTASPSRCSG